MVLGRVFTFQLLDCGEVGWDSRVGLRTVIYCQALWRNFQYFSIKCGCMCVFLLKSALIIETSRTPSGPGILFSALV